jgi:hypothetical protein
MPLMVLISIGVDPTDEADMDAEDMDIDVVCGLFVVELVLLGGPTVVGVTEYP